MEKVPYNKEKEGFFGSIGQELKSLKNTITGKFNNFFNRENSSNWFNKNLNELSMSILGIEIIKDTAGKASESSNEKISETKNAKNEEHEAADMSQPLMYLNYVKENTQAFGEKTIEISSKLGINPNRLMRVMYKESTLNHTAINHIGSVGLIQFTRDNQGENFKIIGGKKYLLSDIRNMSNLDQLDLIYQYYKPLKSKISSYEDLYLATFYPVAMGKPDSFILGSEKNARRAQRIGEQNKGINNGNPISVTNIKQRIRKGIPPTYATHFEGSNSMAQAA